jgi:tripartite-type tricarboxylate transporter receptor subunit TctC
MGNSGMGANYHVSALGFEMVTGVIITHVPFKGAAALVTDPAELVTTTE